MMSGYRVGVFALLLIFRHVAWAADTSRGAFYFVNYCSGCHSVKYVSWSNVLTDLPIKSEETVRLNADFKLTMPDWTHNGLSIGLEEEEATLWFGAMPPDLSNIAKIRGKYWLKAYLNGFYHEDSRPYGVSNRLVQNVMMPNVLEPLQKEMTAPEYDLMIDDIVLFLEYLSDPSRNLRYRLGIIVVGFLVLCSSFFYVKKLRHQ